MNAPSGRSHNVAAQATTLLEYLKAVVSPGEPADPAACTELLEALARVADEDPSFRYAEDPDTGQLLVSGMGELHLEIVAERLRRELPGLAVDAVVAPALGGVVLGYELAEQLVVKGLAYVDSQSVEAIRAQRGAFRLVHLASVLAVTNAA